MDSRAPLTVACTNCASVPATRGRPRVNATGRRTTRSAGYSRTSNDNRRRRHEEALQIDEELRDEVERLNAEIRILQRSEEQPSTVSQSVMLEMEIMKQMQHATTAAKVKMSSFLTIDASKQKRQSTPRDNRRLCHPRDIHDRSVFNRIGRNFSHPSHSNRSCHRFKLI